MCIQIKRFRREVSKEENVYYLLLRALLLFYQHPTFKQDCAVALFLLSYSEFVVGSISITMPSIFERVRVPFKYVPQWQFSPYNKKSNVEMLMEKIKKDDETAATFAWQYTRLIFASLWFNGFEQLIRQVGTENDTRFYYTINGQHMTFDPLLCLTKSDVLLVQGTTIRFSMDKWLQTISNATSYVDVSLGVAGIENYTLIPNSKQEHLIHNNLILAIRRFCSATPNTPSDEAVYEIIIQILASLVEKSINYL